ncbi:MAG: TIGR04283 family arsenosugar biosynthesis glycosyltransferase [Hyphomicrobiaceae bacterium]
MITVVIPTLNSDLTLATTLTSLVPGVVAGVVRDVVIVDAGSTDHTLAVADSAGAEIISVAQRGRGPQLRTGAAAARGDWLLFLHSDTALEPGWEAEVAGFIDGIRAGRRDDSAAAFRFALDDSGLAPRVVEAGVSARCSLFGLPYGDQGLLVSRALYDAVGGYPDLPLMEDVEIVRRLGRKRVTMLRSRALTSAARYRRAGYASRVVRNWTCLVLHRIGVPIGTIQRIYGGRDPR